MMTDVSSRLRGELPPDVEARLRRQAAELGLRSGVMGEAQGKMVARDLGLTSLDMANSGHQLAGQASTFAAQAYGAVNQVLQMPVESGIRVNAMLEPWRPPTLDPGGIFSGLLSANMRAGTQSADSLAAGMRGYALDIAKSNQWQAEFDSTRSQISQAQKAAATPSKPMEAITKTENIYSYAAGQSYRDSSKMSGWSQLPVQKIRTGTKTSTTYR
jgi:hypothetical protein